VVLKENPASAGNLTSHNNSLLCCFHLVIARPPLIEHIEQLLKDYIIEISNSPFLKPLTVVPREGKTPSICVDAIKINDVTIPDRARIPQLNELIQKFHGIKYVTSIDLSSAFLQIPLKKESTSASKC
jgi:hypothetical protein